MMTKLALVICLVFGAAPGILAASPQVMVIQVIDGDTCVLEDGRKIRYLGIDAPEKGDPHALAATQTNNRLVGGKKVRLDPPKPAKDSNGRLLAYVFVGKVLINEELVRTGMAHVRRPVSRKYAKRFLKAQEEARQSGLGIWKTVSHFKLRITELRAKPQFDRATRLNGEYVVIKNEGAKAVPMTGWTLSDEANHRYLFPQFVLPPGKKVTVRTGLGKNSESELFWGSRGAIWNDNGDTVWLRDFEGNLILSHVY